MANSYFQMKQFRVEQSHSAMKVSTDACIFGAITANYFAKIEGLRNVLDIGAGTGILTLMLKQKLISTVIHAVERDEKSIKDLRNNCAQSLWKNDIIIFHENIQDFNSSICYDAIICNPPFFTNQLLTTEIQRRGVRHTEHLSWKDLIENSYRLLKNNGLLALLLPLREWNFFVKNIDTSWSIVELHYVRPNNKKVNNRIVVFLQKSATTDFSKVTSIKFWTIYSKTGKYTAAITKLLQEYYLYLD
ncbi:MAG TPA: methyltransferase [Chitinophagaceae bacterium]|nr:methyltransferase [Chitinophagaceae bacterium]